ncbi:hypothetical protein [Streptomyces sp. NPDC052012]|uniref:hypothetical protein n=1 Tax=Streptomyces sp. NPDC052012 TaxID=3155051 RepID=UPI00344FEA2D
MNSTPTTPPRPFDVTAAFPQLAPLARTATRLHPRPGAPSPQDSSIGGPLLWPVDELWPHCDGPHVVDGMNLPLSPADVRLERRIRAASRGRSLTPQERQTLERIRPPRQFPLRVAVAPYEGSIAMLPVAQLYTRDVPDLHAPEGADLLQVLWCPFDHPIMPKTALFWRSAATVTDILTTPPEPPAMQFDGYLPEPCLLNPEQVTEYPDHLELSEELQAQLGDWSVWQTAGTHAGRPYASYLEESFDRNYASGQQETRDSERAWYLPQYYDNELAGAPGWKVGGWPRWGATDPIPRRCPSCDSGMDALLTIATFEGDHDSSWLPHEDPADEPPADFDPRQPTAVQIGSGYDQQLYVCPAAPEHPHVELMH